MCIIVLTILFKQEKLKLIITNKTIVQWNNCL